MRQPASPGREWVCVHLKVLPTFLTLGCQRDLPRGRRWGPGSWTIGNVCVQVHFWGKRFSGWSRETVSQQRLRITGRETGHLILLCNYFPQSQLRASIYFNRDNLVTILRWANLKITHFIWKRSRIRKIKYIVIIPKILFTPYLLSFLFCITNMSLHYYYYF